MILGRNLVLPTRNAQSGFSQPDQMDSYEFSQPNATQINSALPTQMPKMDSAQMESANQNLLRWIQPTLASDTDGCFPLCHIIFSSIFRMFLNDSDIDLPMLPPPSVPSERSVSVVVTLSSQSPHHHCHPSSQKPPLQDMSHLAMLQKIKTQLG